MQSNKRNLISVLVVAGLFLAIILAGVAGNIRSGNYVVLPIVFTSFAICGVAIWFSHFRVRVLLRDRKPDRIIAHYHSSVKRIPFATAAAAYLSALAATFFGEFDRARAELDAVDWREMPPMYQGHRKYVLAMLALLEETDSREALRLAAEARDLEEGASAGGLQLLDDSIRLVAEDETAEKSEIIARLQRTAQKQQGLIPGVCAWALAVYYKRKNEPNLAQEYTVLLRIAIPHCAPLQSPTNAAGL